MNTLENDSRISLFFLAANDSSNQAPTPLRQWGFRQCLPFNWTTIRGKHCRHLIMGVVDTFGHLMTKMFLNKFCPICLP